MSGARTVSVGVTAALLFLGVGGSAFPTEAKPRLPSKASPLAHPYTPQLMKDDRPDPPAGAGKSATP
ncbi:hypothetical protein ACFQ07_23080, partial [Actinomadura adrarensis]